MNLGMKDFTISGKGAEKRDSRSGFIVQKFENLMKNTFCLRNK